MSNQCVLAGIVPDKGTTWGKNVRCKGRGSGEVYRPCSVSKHAVVGASYYNIRGGECLPVGRGMCIMSGTCIALCRASLRDQYRGIACAEG